MSHVLEYVISLQDKMSAKLKQIGTNSDSALTKLGHLQKQGEKTGHSLGMIGKITGALGLGGGMFEMFEMMKSGVEKTHNLHLAESQLSNTMQNMGTFSQEAFEKIVEGSKNMAKGVKFSASEILGLQSQIRLVGNIGEGEMQRLVTASADMATKFGMGLGEAGNAIAKAVNNPEMLRRLAMQLKIDPKIVAHLQSLAKHGHEAAARLQLLNIIEQKVGGAAKAAFDADPLAKFHKAMDSIKITMGDALVKVQAELAPALVKLANIFKTVIVVVSKVVVWFTENKVWTIILATSIGILSLAVNYLSIVATVLAAKLSIVAFAKKLWAIAQWEVNLALFACPLGWIVLAIIAIVAAVILVTKYFTGFGETWTNVMTYMKLGWILFKDSAVLIWLELKDAFISGFEIIEKGWYKLQSLWNKDAANAGLSRLQKDSFDRAAEIAKAQNKVKETAQIMSGMQVWAIRKKEGASNPLDIFEPNKALNKIGNPKKKNPNKENEDSISSGGSRPTNITINLGKLMDSLNIHSQTLNESSDEVEKKMVALMLRVINSGNAVVGR